MLNQIWHHLLSLVIDKEAPLQSIYNTGRQQTYCIFSICLYLKELLKSFLNLTLLISDLKLTYGRNNIWSYMLSSQNYYSQKAYKIFVGSRVNHADFNWYWKSARMLKHKFVFWGSSQQQIKHNGHARKKRYNSFILCRQHALETSEHLFSTC